MEIQLTSRGISRRALPEGVVGNRIGSKLEILVRDRVGLLGGRRSSVSTLFIIIGIQNDRSRPETTSLPLFGHVQPV